MQRRLLMAIVNAFKWLAQSFTNLYNSLIPTTISSKSVKNRAKISKVYGNSVVENQIFYPRNSGSPYGVTVTNNGDETLTFSGQATSNGYQQLNDWDNHPITFLANHKYLIIGATTNLPLIIGSTTLTSNGIFAPTSQYTQIQTFIANGTTYNETKTIQIFDLTQMFPFDTPTTLSDVRVQALLNRGYIPYNSGEIKNVDISEFSTTKADTTALDTLPFIYQGSGAGTSHDTFEITKTEYVFTKNIGSVDLGSLDWGRSGGGIFFYNFLTDAKAPTSNGSSPNILCDNYLPVIRNAIASVDKQISLDTNKSLVVNDTSYTDATTFKTAMSGVLLYYELATPQVIRIPKKHLGIVNLGSLNWGNSTSYGSNQISQVVFNNGVASSSVDQKANIYCSKYMIGTRNANINSIGYITYSTISGNNYLSICLGSTTMTSSQYQQALSGIYLFYETESEVADIEDMIKVEAGGTFTSDSNVLPNVDFNVKCK